MRQVTPQIYWRRLILWRRVKSPQNNESRAWSRFVPRCWRAGVASSTQLVSGHHAGFWKLQHRIRGQRGGRFSHTDVSKAHPMKVTIVFTWRSALKQELSRVRADNSLLTQERVVLVQWLLGY